MKPVKTAIFRGTLYDIQVGEPLDGYVDTDDKYALVVTRDLNTKTGLESLIHEALHACNWHAKEQLVGETARDVARFLWRLNYRRVGAND